jgi:hypothetical protein
MARAPPLPQTLHIHIVHEYTFSPRHTLLMVLKSFNLDLDDIRRKISKTRNFLIFSHSFVANLYIIVHVGS